MCMHTYLQVAIFIYRFQIKKYVKPLKGCVLNELSTVWRPPYTGGLRQTPPVASPSPPPPPTPPPPPPQSVAQCMYVCMHMSYIVMFLGLTDRHMHVVYGQQVKIFALHVRAIHMKNMNFCIVAN